MGPHQESDPNANATHVNPSVIKTKLLLKKININQETLMVEQLLTNIFKISLTSEDQLDSL
jgi:hypothetical protein